MSEININDSGFSPFESSQNNNLNAATSDTKTTSMESKKLDKLMKSLKQSKPKADDEEDSDKSSDDPKEHQRLVNQINRYFASKFFGKMLRDMKYEHNHDRLMKKSVSQLNDQIARMQLSVSNSNNGDSSKLMFKVGLPMIESLLDPIYPCKGFSSALLNPKNEDFEKLLEEYSLQHEAMYISPFMRIIGSVAISILTANRCHEILAKQTEMKQNITQGESNTPLPKSNLAESGFVEVKKSELPASNLGVTEPKKSLLPESNINKTELHISQLPPSNIKSQ
jgi:hypothetical protein